MKTYEMVNPELMLCKAKRFNWRDKVEDERWVTGYLIRCQAESMNRFIYGIVPASALNFSILEIDNTTVCRFTGLKDRGGTKIFEHDKISIIGEDDLFEVEWDVEKLKFCLTKDGYHMYDFDEFDDFDEFERGTKIKIKIKVVGNKFDSNLISI